MQGRIFEKRDGDVWIAGTGSWKYACAREYVDKSSVKNEEYAAGENLKE